MAWTDPNITRTYGNMARQRKNALDIAYMNQYNLLQGQLGNIGQQYNDVRSQAYTNSHISALGNNEALAAQGLAGNAYDAPTSGYSETSRVAQNIGLGNALNAAYRDQANAANSVNSQIAQQGFARDAQWAGTQGDLLSQELASQQAAYQTALAKAQAEVQMFGQVKTKEAADVLGVPVGTKMKSAGGGGPTLDTGDPTKGYWDDGTGTLRNQKWFEGNGYEAIKDKSGKITGWKKKVTPNNDPPKPIKPVASDYPRGDQDPQYRSDMQKYNNQMAYWEKQYGKK